MEKLTFEAVNPADLSHGDFVRVNEVMQDIWASHEGLWELVQCKDCQKMVSKEDVFGHLSADLTQKTVAEIMRILGMDSIPCTVCGGETRYIYWPDNVEKIKKRLLRSIDSFLVLAHSETDGIVGFEEAYVDPLEEMFELDFTDHYGNVGLPEIRKRVDRALGYVPDEILLTSSLGLLEPYRNFQNLFGIMERFSLSLPESYAGMPGMAELNRGGVTHRMSSVIKEGISLGIEDVPELRAKMTAVGEKYQCDLIVYPDSVGMHKNHFTHGMKHFLRMSQGSKRAVTRKGGESVVAVHA